MKIHFVPKKWIWLSKRFGETVCGMTVMMFDNEATSHRKQVTCGNCKRTVLFRKVR